MRTNLIALLIFTAASVSFAQQQPAPATIGWSQIPTSGFGSAPRRPPRSAKAKERVAKIAAEKQEKVFGPLVGRRFYGLCEVRVVKPANAPVPKSEAYTVTALECVDHFSGKAGPLRLTEGGLFKFAVRWKTSESSAMDLAAGHRFNVAGEIESVKVVPGDESQIIIVDIKDAKF